MNKSFLMLPIATLIVACSSTSLAPVENADGVLSPGVMEPVGQHNNNPTWQPQIEQQSMPENMQVSPSANINVEQNRSQAISPTTKQINNVTTETKPKVSQHFEIPRDPQTNYPVYSKIDKGFYKEETYQVRKGDTMFLIAYIAGMDVKELAALNNLKEPYTLSVGQVLKISNNATALTTTPTTQSAKQPTATQPAKSTVTYTQGPNGTKYGSDGTIIGPVKSTQGASTPIKPANPMATQPILKPQPTNAISNVAWYWPTNGSIVQGFSTSDGGNKGIDIKGSRGQAVNAAASGRVVYAGNALRGYGNLIIIKHNDDFLSAYAHNESILVRDQQEVKAGQQIAKMGSSGTNDVKLHFEVRYKGKSVDPMRYLPKR
ncbi:murein hydrolase activator NlpD [Seminibacterium arietis]|uniref:Murein hydrolase activator NlpD n=1 Tax=Seminibacterium arietis TaxID=1173502 RepID=A0ABW3I889_9PAST